MRVALVACSNGLGHLRRMILLANALCRDGQDVRLYGRSTDVRHLTLRAGLHLDPRAAVKDLDTETSAHALRNDPSRVVAWVGRLEGIDQADCVVSDNLPEILTVRPDAVLCGQFLWDDVIEGVAEDYRRRVSELLERHRPEMIATRRFVMPALAQRTRLRHVGLWGERRTESSQRADLLISCGLGGVDDGGWREVIAEIARASKPPFDRVFVEPRLLPDEPPAWMLPATYDEAMYGRIKGAIIRPGMGTITECLLNGVSMKCVYEGGNAEMEFNTSVLAEMGIGARWQSRDVRNAIDSGFVDAFPGFDSQPIVDSIGGSDAATNAADIVASRFSHCEAG